MINTDIVPIYMAIKVETPESFADPNHGPAYHVQRKYLASDPATAEGKDPVREVDEMSSSQERYGFVGEVTIPVYVGVGLRLLADVRVLKGTVNLASLGAIAASVEAGSSAGSLTVQTLGLSGEKVMSAMPLPSKLNQTTVENAILAIGTIKALMYDEDKVNVTPRVTGFFLPLRYGSADLVNLIYAELAKSDVPWFRNCTKE